MTVEYNKNSYIDGLYIESVIVMGVRSQVNYIMINNVQEHSHYTYNSSLMVGFSLVIRPLNKSVQLTLNASIATKVVCFCHLLKCIRSL